jgi:riboflavin kinase/FMN adenylyltransferase
MLQVTLGSHACTPAARVVAVGNFDGVHAGHRALLAVLTEQADARGARATVTTFDPAPTAVLAPERHQPRIMPLADRVALLGQAGVEEVVVESFDRPLGAHPARWFAREFLARRLGAVAVVVGYDFRFGHGREGTAALLREWLPGVEVIEVAPLEDAEGPLSSSRVRKLVAAGRVEAAAALLGRPHRLVGTVVQGDQRGRTIGFPTANLLLRTELLPANGVYAVRVRVDGTAPRPGVMNLGTRPTVDGTRLSPEVHLLDFQGDLYGRELAVELVARLRDEVRFASLDALVTQIRLDAAQARTLLAVEPTA